MAVIRVFNRTYVIGRVAFIEKFKSSYPSLSGKHLDKKYGLPEGSSVLVKNTDYLDEPTWVENIEILASTIINIELICCVYIFLLL